MKRLILAAAALVAIETAAYACSCVATDDPAELRRLASDSVGNAVALVEVEALSAHGSPQGERLRVVRTIAGEAPAQFTVQRGPFPSSASCDQLYDAGQGGVVILYAAEHSVAAAPAYVMSGLCTTLLLEKAAFRDEVARLIAGRLAAGERG